MATSEVWWNTVGSGSNSRIYLSYDRIDNDGDSAWLVNPRVHWVMNSGWSDSNNYIDVGGSAVTDGRIWTGSAGAPLNSSRTWSVGATDVPISYGTTTDVTFTVTVYGVAYFRGDGTSSTFTWTIPLPERPYSPPPRATGFAAAYADVNKANLSWNVAYTGTNGATPLAYQYIDRTEGASWDDPSTVNISGQLGWSPTSWQDTSLKPNKRYRYRHVGQGPGGWSPYSPDSAWIYTKPAPPSAVSAAKQVNNDIVITATNAAPHASKWEFSDSANGTSGWTVLTSTHTSATYTHAAPSQIVPHYYRVRAQTPDGKWSDYSVTSNVVQLQSPPNPPTWKTTDPAYDASSVIVSSFTHNPVDTTAQTAYEMRWQSSADGSTWSAWTSTGKVASTASSRTWAANTFPQNSYIRLESRTWGSHANPSAWSASAQFRTSARPVIGISSPTAGQVLSSKYATVAWNYSDVEGSTQSSWKVLLKTGAGAILDEWSGSGAQSSFAIPYVLADDTAYQVTVEARDGVGLWSSPVTRSFSVNYLPPPPPGVEVQWDVTRAAGVLDISNPSPAGGEPPSVFNDIYRDGVRIATGYPINTVFVDPLPRTVGSTYVVEAVSALPSSAPSLPKTLPWDINVYRRFWLNAGPRWTTVASFYANVSRSKTSSLSREREVYSGREWEVETIGELRRQEFSFSAQLEQSEDSPDSFHEVALTPTVVCFREPGGTYFVSLAEVSESTTQSITAGISVRMSRVDFTEEIL